MARTGEKKGLLSIGEMARLFNTNIRTFRYYDRIGLLSPEYVDGQTGYRYYSSAQFERMNTIKYLRALGVPLERISSFFEQRDVDDMLGIFAEQLEQVHAKQAELALIERKIAARIDQIESARASKIGELSFVDLPARRAVVLERYFAPGDDLEPLIRALGKEYSLEDDIFLGKVGVSVSREDLAAGSFDRLSSVFILLDDGELDARTSSEVPGGEHAVLSFRGTHAQAAAAYATLMEGLRKHGREACGPSVEITMIDAGMTNDTSQFVTQIQVPVA